MKKDIHPSSYREVVFKDMSNDEIFITRSTVATKETIEVDGVTYPLVKLEITSSSHPFFTESRQISRSYLYANSEQFFRNCSLFAFFCRFYFKCLLFSIKHKNGVSGYC